MHIDFENLWNEIRRYRDDDEEAILADPIHDWTLAGCLSSQASHLALACSWTQVGDRFGKLASHFGGEPLVQPFLNRRYMLAFVVASKRLVKLHGAQVAVALARLHLNGVFHKSTHYHLGNCCFSLGYHIVALLVVGFVVVLALLSGFAFFFLASGFAPPTILFELFTQHHNTHACLAWIPLRSYLWKWHTRVTFAKVMYKTPLTLLALRRFRGRRAARRRQALLWDHEVHLVIFAKDLSPKHRGHKW